MTQAEVVKTVEGISEYFLLPALKRALKSFLFNIINFHSDNGSEYINKNVARLLQKLVIDQTKSSPRHTNDNPLAEGKTILWCVRITGMRTYQSNTRRRWTSSIRHTSIRTYFCTVNTPFQTKKLTGEEKLRKCIRTTCEKLLLVKNIEQYLKEGVTMESLKAQMLKKTHLAATQEKIIR